LVGENSDTINSILSAKYSTGVVPIPERLGGSVTTKKAGAEIAEDSFDIVSDAKKYLGETRDYFGY